jgi:hypothetical protein|nr:MAG TPA: hypothetical protein [Caudoviricetes sp.]
MSVLNLPNDSIKIILVPEPIVEDLKAVGYTINDLLYYDKASKVLNKNALKIFTVLNSKYNPQRLDFVYGSEVLTPVLSETLDVRDLWLETSDQDTREEIRNDFVASDDNSGYSLDQYEYDASQALLSVLNGLDSAMASGKDIYEDILPANDGKYFFIILPFIKATGNESSYPSKETLSIFAKNVLATILRKSAFYHDSKTIAQSSIFVNYLATKLNM